MTNFLQFTASRFLFLLTFIVTIFSSNAGQAWFPQKGELEVMSLRSAIIVNVIILALLAGLAYLIVQFILAII
jgi:hypothetical protein